MARQRLITARAGNAKGQEPGPLGGPGGHGRASWGATEVTAGLPGGRWDHRANTDTARDITEAEPGADTP